MLPTSAGVEPATSWSPVGRRIQLSHRGRQSYVLQWLLKVLVSNSAGPIIPQICTLISELSQFKLDLHTAKGHVKPVKKPIHIYWAGLVLYVVNQYIHLPRSYVARLEIELANLDLQSNVYQLHYGAHMISIYKLHHNKIVLRCHLTKERQLLRLPVCFPARLLSCMQSPFWKGICF